MVKKLEQELGVVTQLICAQTAQGVLKKMRTTAYNVVAKMNQKLGGTVYDPWNRSRTDSFKASSRIPKCRPISRRPIRMRTRGTVEGQGVTVDID